MSDEKRRIFTHPDVVQAGSYTNRYNPTTRILKCTVCGECWHSHSGWSCPDSEEYVLILPDLHATATVTTACACWGCGAEAAWSALDVTMRCNTCRAKRGLPPIANRVTTAPTLYDGLTAEQCIERYTGNMQRADDTIPWPLSPVQLTAGRDLWQQQLRARISAAKERERCRVRIEQDAEDEPWRWLHHERHRIHRRVPLHR